MSGNIWNAIAILVAVQLVCSTPVPSQNASQIVVPSQNASQIVVRPQKVSQTEVNNKTYKVLYMALNMTECPHSTIKEKMGAFKDILDSNEAVYKIMEDSIRKIGAAFKRMKEQLGRKEGIKHQTIGALGGIETTLEYCDTNN